MSFGHSRPSLGKLLSSGELDSRSSQLSPRSSYAQTTRRTLANNSYRTITAAAVVVSAAGYSGLLSLYHYIFVSQYVFTVSMLPQLWRLFTAFLITKPKFGILLDPYFLYQYGSSIERESPRFKDPGDFFVYTLFLGSVIVVSTHCTHAYIASIASTQLSATSRLRSKSPPHICPPSLLFLAEAVPGTEEEYPCTSCGSVIRNHIKGLVWCVGMVGLSLEKALRMLSISQGGVGSLHTFATSRAFVTLFALSL